jgi:hypothetical protein
VEGRRQSPSWRATHRQALRPTTKRGSKSSKEISRFLSESQSHNRESAQDCARKHERQHT